MPEVQVSANVAAIQATGQIEPIGRPIVGTLWLSFRRTRRQQRR